MRKSIKGILDIAWYLVVFIMLQMLATYLVSNSNYGSYELSMMAVGAAIAMSMFLALRGSLAETVGETLGVTGVTGTEVVKRNIIFTLVLTAAIVVFLVAGSSLKFLMI